MEREVIMSRRFFGFSKLGAPRPKPTLARSAPSLRMGLAVVFVTVLIPSGLRAQVTYDRLLRATQEPQNWLTYSGDYASLLHSALKQIDPNNVKNLEQKWVFQADTSLQNFEATPLVVDGIMYLTEAPNHIYAVDAKTGRSFWDYQYNPSKDARVCCGSVTMEMP